MKKLEIIEDKDKVRVSLKHGDTLDVYSLTDKIKIECIQDELFFNGVKASVIVEKSEEEKAIEAMKEYIEKDKE